MPLTPRAYQLLDFGGGRKLESFAGYLIDRPSPAAVGVSPARPAAWSEAAVRWEGSLGKLGVWAMRRPAPGEWRLHEGGWSLELRLTDSGQIGVFPEQRDNWRWLGEQVRSAAERLDGRPPRVLNLFGYTGASTLAAAAAGAAVTHVDAARSAIAWARRNAELSGLAQAPIRWIAEDARRFVERERKRGRRYDAVVLDPPSYGHGPAGEVWRFDEHLPDLLEACGELTGGEASFMLMTCHSPGVGPREATEILASAIPSPARGRIEAAALELESRDGRRLNAGVMVRFGAVEERSCAGSHESGGS